MSQLELQSSKPPAPPLAADAGVEVAVVGHEPGQDHPVAVYLARLAPSGRRSQASGLARIAGLLSGGRADAWTLPWHRLSYAHTQAVRTALAETYAPATANRLLSAMRGVLAECWRLELMDAETYRRAADVAAVTGSRLPTGRALTQGELAALFASCQPGRPGDIRDAAMLAVLYAGGLRRAEAIALNVDDYQREAGELLVRSGKGNKARKVYAPGGAADALEAWIALRGRDEEAHGGGPLFVPVDKAGRLGTGRLSGQAVRALLARRAGRAKVAGFTPHDLRRTCVSQLLEAGADLAVVQQLAGHASPATTERYDRRPEAVRRQAAGLLHVPYQPPAR